MILRADDDHFKPLPVAPCIRYDPRKVNPARLAPPPADPPRAEKISKTIAGFNTSETTEKRRQKVYGIPGAECEHPRWGRIAAWTPKGGKPRVRARCLECRSAERIMFLADVTFVCKAVAGNGKAKKK